MQTIPGSDRPLRFYGNPKNFPIPASGGAHLRALTPAKLFAYWQAATPEKQAQAVAEMGRRNPGLPASTIEAVWAASRPR